ncbi:hypothetical protein, partial [Prevotella sp.]|uniref:hypothetical protein n=1 Tax=Prevotella sp. TaxID=59823 RepID=UPI0025FEE388
PVLILFILLIPLLYRIAKRSSLSFKHPVLVLLFTFQQLIFVNLKDDKNKRNAALFCNVKAKLRCVYCK